MQPATHTMTTDSQGSNASSDRSCPTASSPPLSASACRSCSGRPLLPGQATGQRKRSYTFISRQAASTPSISEDLQLRTSKQGVINSFFHEDVLKPCCGNQCCLQLAGSGTADLMLEPAEFERLNTFVEAVVETRKAIHLAGQNDSRQRLRSRLRLGFQLGSSQPEFAIDYCFPGSMLASAQQYWWQLEDGSCVQVCATCL